MRTGAEYRQKLNEMRRNVYIDGDLVGRDDPRLGPGINTLSMTYELVDDPEFKDLLTATSHFTGKKINRFCHIYKSPEDLVKSHELTRAFQCRLGTCIARCGGRDLLNAVGIVSHDVDQSKGTQYHQRWLKYMEYFEEGDLFSPICITDSKGDRSLRPSQQKDPDQYLHIVEKKSDGIVVRGCKQNISNAAYADELVTLPTRALRKGEADWAVAFAIPADSEGIKLLTRCSAFTPRKNITSPYSQYGSSDSFVIFDDVFIPWERVFLCGEVEAAPTIGVLGAMYHRFNYSACKPAVADIFIGAVALAAEYNNVEKAPHIAAKLADLIMVSELVYAAGTAAATLAKRTASTIFMPDEILVHAARYLAGKYVYHEYEILADVGGGVACTLPGEGVFDNIETQDLAYKYLTRKEGVPPEHVHLLWRFIQDIVAGPQTGRLMMSALHGGGSPIMEQIGLKSSYNLQSRKDLVKRLCGIPTEETP